MTVFWIITIVLSIAAVAALLYPVMRAKSDSPRYLVFLVTGLGVPALALGIYLSLGSWRAPDPAPHAQQQDLAVIVEQLANRLQREGGSLDEWMMLGKSFTMMARYGDAATAYAQARKLAGNDNLDVLAFYAEATVLADQSQLTGEAGQMFEQILAERPNDPRGLWYGGMSAYEQSQFGLAVSRWQQLLSQAPPETLRPILEERISDAQSRMSAQVMPLAAMPSPPKELSARRRPRRRPRRRYRKPPASRPSPQRQVARP